MTNKRMKTIKRIVFILLGTFVMSLGAVIFNIPSHFAAGGVGGLAQAINYLMPNINIGILMAILNIVVFVLGTYFLGREFGIFTIVGAAGYTIFIGILQPLLNITEPILKDNIANLVLGGALIGIGLSIVFRQNASTGGTDLIAKIIEKYSTLELSRCILIVDSSVILFATFVFGIESGIYSFMSLLITTYALDISISGFNSKIQMVIISDKIDLINEYIIREINRGTTFYNAKGGYTKKDKNILTTIVDKKQYVKIKNFIKNHDEEAFVYITNINEVIGFGFSREHLND